jgi:Bystin
MACYASMLLIHLSLLCCKRIYSLQVIGALINHFMRFVGETRELPVLWHRSLLVFVQRYKKDISQADRERYVTSSLIIINFVFDNCFRTSLYCSELSL